MKNVKRYPPQVIQPRYYPEVLNDRWGRIAVNQHAVPSRVARYVSGLYPDPDGIAVPSDVNLPSRRCAHVQPGVRTGITQVYYGPSSSAVVDPRSKAKLSNPENIGDCFPASLSKVLVIILNEESHNQRQFKNEKHL